MIALTSAFTLAAGGCGDEEHEVPALPASVDAPGTEGELAFCLGMLADPNLDDPGRYDLVSRCTGLDREAVATRPSFVACLSGLARSTPNREVEEHLDRCLKIFGGAVPPGTEGGQSGSYSPARPD